jgi:hypothetical protein
VSAVAPSHVGVLVRPLAALVARDVKLERVGEEVCVVQVGRRRHGDVRVVLDRVALDDEAGARLALGVQLRAGVVAVDAVCERIGVSITAARGHYLKLAHW